jgi:outer membrane receptor protein involved in Fe transport
VNVEGKDDYYFSDSHAERSSSYELLNASLTYSAEAWEVSLWARNLADEDYFVRGFFFGNDPRDGYTARGFTQLGAPRQFGVSAVAGF